MHGYGAEATTMLGEAGVALAYQFADEELGAVSHVHPTLPEIIEDAALAASGRAIHARRELPQLGHRAWTRMGGAVGPRGVDQPHGVGGVLQFPPTPLST